MSEARIQPENINTLSTIHGNFVETVENLFSVINGDSQDVLKGYNETTTVIRQFLGDAMQKNKSVRAVGGNWSWTKVAFTKHWMLNTLRLNRMKRMLPEEQLLSYGQFEADKLFFAQCGCNVMELNRVLESLGRSIRTSGASNGQSIAGLISNCTHGSAIDIGPTPDFVVGLHLILGPDKHVYLERSSQPVVSESFLHKIGAEHIVDDEIFNAAVVSFGSFGFIHGVMIETEPRFLLHASRKLMSAESIIPLMTSLDFSQADFMPVPNRRPFHFQITINPYDLKKGFYVSTMYREEYKPYNKMVLDIDQVGPGEDAPILMGKLTEMLPVITAPIVAQTLKVAYKEIDSYWGTHGEIFSASLARGKVLSCAIGTDLAHTKQVLDIANRLNDEFNFVGVFAFRFVRQTKATLGFIKFPVTCIAEFDSFEAKSTWRFYEAMWQSLDEAGIPYTFHWGKINNLDALRVRKMYGDDVDRWIAARNKLMSAQEMALFTNDFMRHCGLDQVNGIV